MKPFSYRISDRYIGLAAVCIVTAVVLLAAAWWEPKKNDTQEWIPLNDEVELALDRLSGQFAEAEVPQADETSNGLGGSETPSQEEKKNGSEAAMHTSESSLSAEAAEPAEASVSPIASEDAGKLDINRATAEELDALKGIGPAKARTIVEDREKNGYFKSPRDLLRVRGIGEKILSDIQDKIVARP